MHDAESAAHAKAGSLKQDHLIQQELDQRVHTAAGHLAGVQEMIASQAYCVDILRQIAVVQAALSQIALKLVASHMCHCVSSAIRRGEGESEINELVDVLKYLKHF